MRWLSLSLSVLVLAMALLFLHSVDASQPSSDSKTIWTSLKNDLSTLLESSENLEKQLIALQTANDKLMRLSSQQRQDYTELQRQHAQTLISLEQSGQALTDSKSYTQDLARSIQLTEAALVRNRRIWQIGIPAALLLGLVGGYVTNR
jgi:hypothetical protein